LRQYRVNIPLIYNPLLCLNQMLYDMLCVCHTSPTQKLFCLHIIRQAGPPQQVYTAWPEDG